MTEFDPVGDCKAEVLECLSVRQTGSAPRVSNLLALDVTFRLRPKAANRVTRCKVLANQKNVKEQST